MSPASAQGPGQFTVDPEAAERALERALVQTGSTVLPPRSAEVVPFLRFSRSDNNVPGQIVISDGQLVAANITREINEFTTGIIGRAGLPWSGQIDVTIPFVISGQDQETAVLGATAATTSFNLSGLGDVGVSYTQQLRAETGGFPAFLASVSWDSDTGDNDDQIFLGTGFNEFGISLTATQRQDPLVFSGRVGYQRALEKDDIRPGDEISFAAGAFLAVNPETSLQFGLSAAYTYDAEINGDTVDGSDQLGVSLNLGVATILRRNALLDATMSVGVTDDAPDVSLAVNLPLRFTY